MKKIIILLFLAPAFCFAQNDLKLNNDQQQRVPLNNDIDSFSYSIGMNISNSLIQQGINILNLGAMTQAFVDVMHNKDIKFSTEQANAMISKKMQEFKEKKAMDQQMGGDDNSNDGMGKIIPDFQQEDVNGKMINIKSLRGKYVLIDFWASWCGPCRGENPNVLNAFNKYKNKNFTVLGISLDKSKDAWQEAIKHDGLTWQHVSDLKGWSNAVAQQFGIQSIPQNFLIDPTGKIIGKNLRGEALEEKLASVLK